MPAKWILMEITFDLRMVLFDFKVSAFIRRRRGRKRMVKYGYVRKDERRMGEGYAKSG